MMIQVTTLVGTKPVHEASLTWAMGNMRVCTLGECKALPVGEAVRLSLPTSTTEPSSCTICIKTSHSNTYTLKCPVSDGGAFMDVVCRDLHDFVVREIMRTPGVKSEEMWRLSLASRFTATHMNDREHLFAKCACVASFCPTLLAYLTFFRTNLHFANRGVLGEIVRCGRAIYMLQRRAQIRCKAVPNPTE